MAKDNHESQDLVPVNDNDRLPAVNKTDLNKESLEIINQIIAENEPNKLQDLTYLFNQNQNKKTIVRMDRMNNLLDSLTDKMIDRAENRPDEITTKELIDSIKTISGLIENGQKMITAEPEQPLIQINQQNNELTVGDNPLGNQSRESREKVKNVVLNLLSSLTNTAGQSNSTTNNIIDTETDSDN